MRLQVHKVHSDALVGFCVKNGGSLSGDFEKPDTRNPLTTHGLGPKCRVCRVSGTGESPQESSAAGMLREASPVLDSKWTPGRSTGGVFVCKSMRGFGRAGEIRTRDLLHPNQDVHLGPDLADQILGVATATKLTTPEFRGTWNSGVSS